MMLDQKIIQVIFLFEFKMGHKAAETACNINNASGLGAANERTVQWWFKKTRALKMRGVASHQLVSVDYNQLKAIIKAGPLTTT